MEDFTLDELDYKILNLISNDTRVSFLEVSRICNVSGAAVHQRVQKMIANQIITGSEFKLNLQKIGYETCVYLSLKFNQEQELDVITKRLNEVPEIVECHLILGTYDVLVKIYAHNNRHLWLIINENITPLGLLRMDTIISCGESFNKQIAFKTVDI